MLMMLGLLRVQNPKSEPADAHDARPYMERADAQDAGPVGAQSSTWNRLMLMMLGLLGRKAKTEPADADDAGLVGPQSPTGNRLILMMLGL